MSDLYGRLLIVTYQVRARLVVGAVTDNVAL